MASKNKGFKSSSRSKRKARRKKIEIKKEEFRFHGLSIEKLKDLSIEELLPFLPSRIRRTLKRGLTKEQFKLLNDVEKAEKGDTIRTHCRDMVILPSFIDHKIDVHNGNEFQKVTIDPHMIGHYLGEFALTRKKVKHTGPGVGATRGSKYMPLK
jgi:small subunit ribosomal protein S19